MYIHTYIYVCIYSAAVAPHKSGLAGVLASCNCVLLYCNNSCSCCFANC